MIAHGEFEKVLYRSFKEKEHADQFINGKIRFGCIYKYKNIEDEKLRDATEGESHIVVDGSDHHSMHASTRTYIYCFHRSIEAAKSANFGKFIVRLENPRSLAISITDHLRTIDGKFYGGVEGVVVEYDKGESRPKELSKVEMARLIYAQKPRVPFAIEDELRFIVLSKEQHGNSEIFEIDLGKALDNCQLIENI